MRPNPEPKKAFLPPVLCQLALPRSRQEAREFMRRSGDAWLILQAGYIDEGHGPVAQALPYGSMARLVLAYLSTQAVKLKTKEIAVGKNPSQFFDLIGVKGKDGRRYLKLAEQLKALAACRMQFGRTGVTVNPAPPISSFLHWGEGKTWPGVVTLSDEYFQNLAERSVPLNYQALLSLSGSCLAMDIYSWLTPRLCSIRKTKPDQVHWYNLMEQFGGEYSGKNATKDFKREFLIALEKVKDVYPAARVFPVVGGINLFSSPSPIPKKGGKPCGK